MTAVFTDREIDHRCAVHRAEREPVDDDNPITVALNHDKALTAIILGELHAADHAHELRGTP